MSLSITPYIESLRVNTGMESEFRAALYNICVLTGASGTDATGIYSDDNLLPDLYLGPYLELVPTCSLVVLDGVNPVGYAVGAPDTAAFVEEYRRRWLPDFAEKYPLSVTTNSKLSEAEQVIRRRGYTPENMLLPPEEAKEYPAHLHINLLPEAQGKGMGRALITNLCELLFSHGAGGVHLSYSPNNVSAGMFYNRIGFRALASNTAELPRVGLRLPQH